jgi:hypothetical protein
MAGLTASGYAHALPSTQRRRRSANDIRTGQLAGESFTITGYSTFSIKLSSNVRFRAPQTTIVDRAKTLLLHDPGSRFGGAILRYIYGNAP